MEKVNCDLCGSTRCDQLFELYDYWHDRKDLKGNYVRCLGCGLIYQNPRRTSDELGDIYPISYFTYNQATDLFSSWGLKRRCNTVLRHKKGNNLLDIGCSTGTFLQKMRDWHGWNVTGIELNDNAADMGRKRFNLNIYTGTLEHHKFNENMFDAITLWDVLEHQHSPINTLREINRILDTNGILVLRVPNESSWDARLFGKYWAGYDCPRHFYVFNKKTITIMLQKCGFTIIDLKTNIGNYLNFVKSVQFWLTGTNVTEKTKNKILVLLNSLPFRILWLPCTYLKNINARSTEMVVTAKLCSGPEYR